MAKIPTILEAGRADGKLIKTNSIYDDNQEKFLSDKIKEIDNNHNTLKDNIDILTNVVNDNKLYIENKLETEQTRATNAESVLNTNLEAETNRAITTEDNLRETINKITNINEHASTAELITVNTLPNSTISNVQQALDDLYNTVIYDVSANNGETVFESLQTLLNSSNLDTLIPTSVRHGGMSIRFIHSSDNKYVQYRYMLQYENTSEGNNAFINIYNWYSEDVDADAKVLGFKVSGGVLFNKRFAPNNQSEIINADGYCITGFIPIDSSQMVYIYANNNSLWNIYNTNKEYLGTESCTGKNIVQKNLSSYTDAAYVMGCVITDSFNNMWLKNNGKYIIFDNTLAEKISDVNTNIATLTQLTQREYTDILSEVGFEFYKAQQESGAIIDSGYQCISPYIDVSSNRRVIVYLGGNAGLYCGYNSNKEFVDYYSCYSTPTARNLPSTINYIRLNIRLTDINNAYVAYNDGTDRKMWVSFITWSRRVADLEAGFVNLNDKMNDVYPLLESGEYSYHKRIDGTNIYNDRQFIVSPYIDIRNNRSLEVFPNGNRTMYVQGYDSEKNYLDYWSIGTGATLTRVLPNTIYYIRVCYDINRQDGVFVKNHLNGDVIWKPFPYWQGALESGDVIALHPHKKVYSLLTNLKNNIDPMTIRPYGDDNLTLLFFSDLHACATPLERIGKFAEEYCIDNNIKYIDAVVAGGDNVNRATDNYTFWEQCGASSFLPVVGNHELLIPEDKVSAGTYPFPQINGVNVALNSMPYSAKFVYDREFAPFLSYTNFTEIIANKCYWYKDFTNSKIRLIGIDDYHWKESPIRLADNTFANEYPDGESLDNGEQLAWFKNTLASAKSLGYSVIVVHHSPALFDSPIQCSFTSLDFQNNIAIDPTIPSGLPYTKEPFEAVQGFIDEGGKFICWLTGHLHQDAVGVIKGFTDQFQMTIDTARYGFDSEGRSLGNGYGHNAHISETTSADCMDIVSVDTYHKQLSLIRIGCDYDRRGRHIGSFVWDYENKQMISCD